MMSRCQNLWMGLSAGLSSLFGPACSRKDRASDTAPNTDAPFGDYQFEIDQARANTRIPALSGAYAMLRAGRPALTQAVSGVLVHGEPTPARANQLWHIGSVTKSMTATLVARLVERGLLDWTMRLGDAFGDIAPDMQATYRNKTIAQMMTGLAGLPTNISVPNTIGHILSEETQTQRRKIWVEQAFAMPAQTGFVYPNNGYVLAGALCEKVAGQPYETLMQQEVFGPLGITTAGFGPPPAGNPQGHRKVFIGRRLMAMGVGETADNAPPMSPAGRAHMSLPDLAKYGLTHSLGHQGRANDFLKQETWQYLHTPPEDAIGTNPYAFGWVKRADGTLWHNGSNTFWLAELAFDPKTSASACACANVFDAAPAVERALAAGLEKARAG